MRRIRNLIVLLALVAVMAAALVVSTSAYISWDEETGTFPGGANSAYADINAPGWVQVAGVAAKQASDGTYISEGGLTRGNGTFNAYFNESTKTVVVESVSGTTITGDSGDDTKPERFAYWAKANAGNVAVIEMRNVFLLNNPGYVFKFFTSATTFKVETQLDEWNGTQPTVSLLNSLTSLETLYCGDWDKETGKYTITRGEPGVIDLRGFKYLVPKTTTYNGTHSLLLFDGAIYQTSATKVILPAEQMLSNLNLTYDEVVISDGTDKYLDRNNHEKNAGYNQVIAAGKACTVLVKRDQDGNVIDTTYTTDYRIATGWETVKVKAADDKFGGDYSGIIPYRFAYNAKKLEVVEIPANVTLKYIEAEAFSGCSSLVTINVKGAVAADLYIENKNAFSTKTNITINVYSKLDKAYMEKALATAGVTNVTVVAEQDQGDLENAVVSGGFSVRMKEYTGLRALFSFDSEAEAKNNANGYTLVSYGVFTTSYKNLVENYASNEDLLFADAREVVDNEGSKVKYVPVYNDDGSGANRYVDIDSRTFCISLTNISSANALSDIYMAGYAIWVDEEYNEYYTITTYDMTDGEKAVNLYEITLGLTKTGIINSENTDDVCFWQTLKVGALKTNEFNTANDATNKGYVLPEDGYFEYLDVDWHEYIDAVNKTGYNYDPMGVNTSASGVVWSVLKHTDDEYVLIIRNKDKGANASLTLPAHSASGMKYSYYAPFDYNYGSTSRVKSGASLTTYNPALLESDYNKIKTLVVDHGITAMGTGAFAGFAKVETIVYPNGLSGKSDYKFIGCSSLKNIIWCHTDENGKPVQHLAEFKAISDAKQSLADLRGMKNLECVFMMKNCFALENVLLPDSFSASAVRFESTFQDTRALRRVWSDGNAMPDDGVVDLSDVAISRITKGAFYMGSAIHTVYLPDSITEIYYTDKNADVAVTLGKNSNVNFICSNNVVGLIVDFVNKLHNDGTVANRTYADTITVNGTSILSLIQTT